MKTLSWLAGAIGVGGLGLVALADPTASAPRQASNTAIDRDTSAIDPDAIAALREMGDYLRTLKAFQVKADVTTEEVLTDGQKVQFASVADLVAERPNRLRLDLSSDKKKRLFLYDGTNFTLYAPRQKFYTTVPAPATIGELAKLLESKYGIDLPFVDLFRWGTPEGDVSAITAAKDIGPSVVDGTTVEHYAFRQNGLDWQVWIQEGEFPLPRKLVLTTLTDDARPQHSSIYTWNLAPSYDSTAFAFVAPDDAKKIAIADVVAMRTAGKK